MDYSDTPISMGAVSSDPNAPGPRPAQDPMHPASNMQASPTGHVSNGLYDVVPFTMKIIVDAGSIPDVPGDSFQESIHHRFKNGHNHDRFG